MIETEPYLPSDSLTVYGDESGDPGDSIFGIGLLYLPVKMHGEIIAKIKKLRKERGFNGTLHYNEMNDVSVHYAKAIINLFMREPKLQFRASIFPGAFFRLHSEQPHHVVSPREFLYGKTYSDALKHGLPRGPKKVTVFAHQKSKKRPDRFRDAIKGVDKRIKDFQEITSESEFIQMCDLLLGCTCGGLRGNATKSAKIEVQQHLLKKLGLADYKEANASTAYKFKRWFFGK